MRWRHPAWTVLGIDPGSDLRPIRVAYAAKLKAIDPETDPQAFVLLREAFEAAQREASALGEAQAAGLPDADAEPEAPPGFDVRSDLEPAGSPRAAADALSALLYGHDENQPVATPEQAEAMLVHWHAIIADPRMYQVAFYDDAERWLAETIARTVPFSDPLVIPAVDHFRWLESDGTIHQPRAVTYLTYRYSNLEFLASIQQPGDQHYEAWRELTTPAGPDSVRGKVMVRKIHRLLRVVRAAYPDIEARFDSARLDLWDPRRTAPPPDDTPRPPQRPDRDNVPRYVLIAIVGYIVVASLFQLAFPNHRATAPAVPASVYSRPLAQAGPDIDRALRGIFDGNALDYATIAKRNPKLSQAVVDLWSNAKYEGASQGQFALRLKPLLDNWYWYGVRNGDAALLADYQRLVLEMAQAIRKRGAAACNQYLKSDRRWSFRLGLAQSLADRDNALMVRALLETDGSLQHKDRTAMVPGDIIEAMQRRAGVPRAVIDNWFADRDIGDRQCDVTLAYMELVLARPRRESVAMLRVM